jgi:predicted NBD/HSP70 family sugar kinase
MAMNLEAVPERDAGGVRHLRVRDVLEAIAGDSPPTATADVLRALRREPAAMRTLVSRLGYSAGTIAKAVTWLRDDTEMLDGSQRESSGQGAPLRPLRFGEHHCVVGVAIIDSQNMPAELVGWVRNPAGGVRDDAQTPPQPVSLTEAERHDTDALLRRIAAYVRELHASVTPGTRLLAAGVVLSGHVEDGVVRASPDTGWRLEGPGWDLRTELEQELNVPVIVENDVTALAIRLLSKQATESPTYGVVAMFDEGIGGGLVLDGVVWRGRHGLAMEPGHLTVDYGPGAAKCRCKRVGCVEAYASPANILAKLDGLTVPTLRKATLRPDDDELTTETFRTAGDMLGRGIANIINTCDPGTIHLYAPPELLHAARGSAAACWSVALTTSIEANAFSNGGNTTVIRHPHATDDVAITAAKAAATLVLEELQQELDPRPAPLAWW